MRERRRLAVATGLRDGWRRAGWSFPFSDEEGIYVHIYEPDAIHGRDRAFR